MDFTSKPSAAASELVSEHFGLWLTVAAVSLRSGGKCRQTDCVFLSFCSVSLRLPQEVLLQDDDQVQQKGRWDFAVCL